MRLLQKAIMRECRIKQFCSVLLLLAGILILVFSFQKSVWLPIIGLSIVITGINLVYQTSKIQQPEDHQIIKLLKNNPSRIVWVYSLITERMPFGFQFTASGTIYFKLDDGDDLSVNLSSKNLKLVSKVLNRILPHASFGYSKDRDQLFSINPNMLRKEDSRY